MLLFQYSKVILSLLNHITGIWNTLEVRLEDLDLRSCNIKIRNRDLLQELISCSEMTSISGLVLRRKVAKLGCEKNVSK